MPTDITTELTVLLNRYSAESVSGTPDFILAKFMIETLKAYNEAVSRRAEWRGETCELSALTTAPVHDKQGEETND